MIKIAVTIRNRLAITKKCVAAIKRHSKIPHQLYLYNNSSNHLLKEHFEYTYNLYKQGLVTQVTFNTDASTYKAFSKASALNAFGLSHEQDPAKDSYHFLVFMDNDIIVTPGWDQVFYEGWKFVSNHKLSNIKVIGQLPGGIKQRNNIKSKIAGCTAAMGKLGGSGLWTVRTNFFRDVGYLDIKQLVGHNKRHDQMYWALMNKKTNGKEYILGIRKKLGYHCGPFAGSVCNILTKQKNNPKKMEGIKFKVQEEKIEAMSFDEFYEKVTTDPKVQRGW